MKKILFQGDSITDCKRDRDLPYYVMGSGYAMIASGKLGYEHPGEYEFYNRGIGGNRIVDVYARIKADILNIKPDYMSLLIGVNDVWHEISKQNGVCVERFKKVYDMLISEILEELPDIKIMLIAPFVTRASATEENWDYFYSEVQKRGQVAKEIAEKYNLKFITLQDKFDEAVKKMPEPYWTIEGVHPTEKGHTLIATEWLKGFEDIK